MQENELDAVMDALARRFPHTTVVDHSSEGFRDHPCYCYVRSRAEDEPFPYTIEEDFLIGEYICIAEDSTDGLSANELLRTVVGIISNSAPAPEIFGMSTDAERIYAEETDEELRYKSNVVKVAFRIRTPSNDLACFPC